MEDPYPAQSGCVHHSIVNTLPEYFGARPTLCPVSPVSLMYLFARKKYSKYFPCAPLAHGYFTIPGCLTTLCPLFLRNTPCVGYLSLSFALPCSWTLASILPGDALASRRASVDVMTTTMSTLFATIFTCCDQHDIVMVMKGLFRKTRLRLHFSLLLVRTKCSLYFMASGSRTSQFRVVFFGKLV